MPEGQQQAAAAGEAAQSADKLAEQLHTVLGRLTHESASLADKLCASLEGCTGDALQHVQLLEQASASVKVLRTHACMHACLEDDCRYP